MIATSSPSVVQATSLAGSGSTQSTSSQTDHDSFSTMVDQTAADQGAANQAAASIAAAKLYTKAVDQNKADGDQASADVNAENVRTPTAAQDSTLSTVQSAADAATQSASQSPSQPESQNAVQLAAAGAPQDTHATSSATALAKADALQKQAKSAAASTASGVTGLSAPIPLLGPTFAAQTTSISSTAPPGAALTQTSPATGSPSAPGDVSGFSDADAEAFSQASLVAASSSTSSGTLQTALGGATLASGLKGGVSVRVTAGPSVAGSSSATVTPAATSSTVWLADLAANGASAAGMATRTTSTDDVATTDQTDMTGLATLLGGAQATGLTTGSTSRLADRRSTDLGGLNAATISGAATELAAAVRAAGSASDSDAEDSNQEGAAKLASTIAQSAQNAAADVDLPEAVVEAAFGGLLTPPLSTTVTDDAAADDVSVSAATISDLASQTAAQAPASGGVKAFRIVLNPEGLGQVNVSVSIGNDGKLTADFAFEKPDSASALSAHAQDLHQALAQSGFDVAPAGLTFTNAATPTLAATSSALSQVSNVSSSQTFMHAANFGAGDGLFAQSVSNSVREWTLTAQTAGLGSAYAGQALLGLDVRV